MLRPALQRSLHRICKRCISLNKSFFMAQKHIAADCITRTVAENTNAGIETAGMVFICRNTSFRHRRCRGVPRLTVHKNLLSTRQAVKSHTDFIHCFNIQKTHQVKTKAVNMIFFRPVKNGINNIFPTHMPLAGNLVSAGRSVSKTAVRRYAVIIIGNRLMKTRVLAAVSMVIDHIHYHANTCTVQCQHHLFHFTDTDVT